jgi:hypothetical protein
MGHASGQQFGDYRLGHLLGEGGFAEVYEADHIHLPGDKAAIKLLKLTFRLNLYGRHLERLSWHKVYEEALVKV